MKRGGLIGGDFSPRVPDYLSRLLQHPVLHRADALEWPSRELT